MDKASRHFAGMILAAALVVLGSYILLKRPGMTLKSADFDMSHSMPRPKSALYNFFFGLEGREIERTEVNPFKDKKIEDKKRPVAAKDAAKIDPKKQQAAAQKAAQQKAAAATASKKPQLKVDVVAAAPTAPLTTEGSEPATNPMQQQFFGSPRGALPGQGSDNKKETLSAAQWRSLVLGQPTKENVQKLVRAFNNKEVDAATLYLIMTDLIQSSNPETQSLGLMIGQSIPSLKSFNIVASHYEGLEESNKKTADAYLLTYVSGSRLSIMALALQSEDLQVVTQAARVMVVGLEQIKNGQNPGRTDSRTEGRGVVASSTVKPYAAFVSIFQNLANSSDSTVAGLAQNALTQIQAL